MLIFKAALIVNVDYTDLTGAKKYLPAGSVIGVSRIDAALHSTDLKGRLSKEKINSFVGIVGHDSFDLAATEFKLIT